MNGALTGETDEHLCRNARITIGAVDGKGILICVTCQLNLHSKEGKDCLTLYLDRLLCIVPNM